MPKGSDNSWAEKLYSKCGKSKHFEKPRFGTSSFLIHHFADRVQYEATGFLEKNRDTVIEEQVDVLRNGDVRKMHNDFYEEKLLEHVSFTFSSYSFRINYWRNCSAMRIRSL